MHIFLTLLDLHRLTSITLCGLAGFMLVISLFVINFLFFLRPYCPDDTPDDQLPKATTILSVRGADPNLTDCVHALLNQDYPDYAVQIVVDSVIDPAWDLIQKTVHNSKFKHVQVKPLATRHNTCSLKCSALIQAISELDESSEVVAFVDADVVTQTNWLRRLVIPLSTEDVGITTAIRWFMPSDVQYGTLVRYFWNLLGSVGAYIVRASWGGSMAMKKSVLTEGKILEAWQYALVEDAMLPKEISKLGLKVKYVPLLMINQERCDLAGCWRFITRQVLFTRLYNKLVWLYYCIVGGVFSLGLLVPFSIGLIALSRHDLDIVFRTSIGLTAYILFITILVLILELKARQLASSQLKDVLSFSAFFDLKILILIPFNIILNTLIIFSVIGLRQIDWRGVNYKIKSPYRIKTGTYQPYLQCENQADVQASIL
jgi:cellulose synthase/poly-beta-1,6-N-acetylglucosamine synthase-like glycosyltransferase